MVVSGNSDRPVFETSRRLGDGERIDQQLVLDAEQLSSAG
jgi:hypothetical protein